MYITSCSVSDELNLSGPPFDPKIGMEYIEFEAQRLNTSRLVGANASIRVYELRSSYYYFDEGVLVHIDSGQRFRNSPDFTLN